MSGRILRDSVIIGLVAIGIALVAANREDIYETIGYEIPAFKDTPQPLAKQNTEKVVPLSGVAISIPKSKIDGQFWTDARVNNGHIHFLVDTGASSVALTPEDAKKAGIRLDTLAYNVPISTAGGENVAAYVNLKSVSVGPVTIRNVRALVVPEGLNTSLLGMTFLGELQKVEATQNAIILRL